MVKEDSHGGAYENDWHDRRLLELVLHFLLSKITEVLLGPWQYWDLNNLSWIYGSK